MNLVHFLFLKMPNTEDWEIVKKSIEKTEGVFDIGEGALREIEMEIKTKPIAEKRAVKEGEIQCIYCHGSGRDPRKRKFYCRVCIGKGLIKIEGPVKECLQCRGTGLAKHKLPCLRCKGRSVISVD